MEPPLTVALAGREDQAPCEQRTERLPSLRRLLPYEPLPVGQPSTEVIEHTRHVERGTLVSDAIEGGEFGADLRPAALAILECRDERRQVAAGRDRRGEPANLNVQADEFLPEPGLSRVEDIPPWPEQIERLRERRLERLAALIPRPRVNLVLYHGVLAPHSEWRARVVAYGAPPGETPVVASASPDANDEPKMASVCRHWAWAALMRRAFDIDVLACPRCGGRLRLIATVEDPAAIRAILVAVAGSGNLAERAPPFAAWPDPDHAPSIGA